VASNARIDAAGAALWREDNGAIELAVVHRDRYDDWSLPKGKSEPGESALQTAIREVGEESGSHVSPSRRLGEVRYRVDGTDKIVRYWAMRHVGGGFAASDEVDKIEWLAPTDALRRLSYPGDRKVVERLLRVALPTSVAVVIRHAKAGKRADWSGTDDLRPLDRTGRTQAKAVATFARLFAPVRIISAEPLRCRQTVQPLAAGLGLPIEIDGAFSDRVSAVDGQRSRDALAALVGDDHNIAICSQGDTIAALVARAATKGSAWVLSCRGGEVISADYYGPASHRQAKIPV
jgi:8-oxo-(d)GTP phosphatase